MTPVDIGVILGGIALIALLARYFFSPQKATHAQVEGGRQVVDVTVKGGYSPSLIRVEAGEPVRLRFNRQEKSDCTARVVSVNSTRLNGFKPPQFSSGGRDRSDRADTAVTGASTGGRR